MNTPTRRDVLRWGVTAAGAAVAAPPLLPRLLAAPSDSYWRLDATAQAALVASGEVSPLELVDSAIERIERLDSRLNAVVTRAFDEARVAARGAVPAGPFGGVPYLIKDLVPLKGSVTTYGSRFQPEMGPAQSSDPYVDRALSGGVIPLGKSNTSELGLLPTTESVRLGPCSNPWNPDFTPGGSSGGSAAAVAAGLVPFAHATDGGGSIRIPASCCGLFGLKPSRGRLGPGESRTPGAIAVQHCVSRSVRDSARMFAVAEYRGPDAALPPVGIVSDPTDEPLRIGLSLATYDGGSPHPEVTAAIREAAALCESLGHDVDEADPPIDRDAFLEAFTDIWAAIAAFAVGFAHSRGADPEQSFEPWTLYLSRLAATRPEGAVEAAVATFERTHAAFEAFLERYDVLLTPTLAAPPVRIGEQAPTLKPETLRDRVTDWVAYTSIHNAMGTPAMSVPLGWSPDRLPIGAHFAAARGAEKTLFELAYQLEAAAPWATSWPALALS